MRGFRRIAAVSLACLLLTGCQDSKPAAPTAEGSGEGSNPAAGTEGKGDASQAPGQQAVKPPVPVLGDAESFEGNWVLAPYMERRFPNFWLFRLAPSEEGPWTMDALYTLPMMGQFKPADLKIDGDSIQFDVQITNPKAQVKQATLKYEGRLQDGKVLGNLLFTDTGLVAPAQLLPTDVDSLEGFQEFAFVEGAAEVDEASKKPDPGRNLWEIAKARPSSPLAVEVYGFLFSQIHQWNFKDEDIQKMADDYSQAVSRWGNRLQGISEINAGSALARAKKSLDVADAFLTAGEKRLGELKLAEGMMKSGRLYLRIARDVQAITGKDEAAAATAYADLQELNKELAYTRPDLLLTTAEYAEKHDQKDAAIQQYLTLVAMPLLEKLALTSRMGLVAGDPTPTSALKALWTEKHGSVDGLREAVVETYKTGLEQVFSQVKEKLPPFPEANPDGKQRVVLTEVFTNTFCEPCVASDLAVELLIQTQPEDRSIVLCYHQQNPGPDPLSSSDGEDRATSYNVQGTPGVYVCGAQIGGTGGLFGAEFLLQSYARLRQPIDHFLQQPSEIKLELKANVADDTLTVDVAPVTGIPEEELGNVRLRLAVAEEVVDYRAPNGIRQHPMVVRTLLGGNKGVAAKQKELKYHLAMPVAELKRRQLAYLIQYEHGKRMKFPTKPAEMKKLRLVAFVQSEKTKEILQAAWTPVTGEWEYPEFKFEEHDGHDHSSDDAAEKTSDEKPAESKSAPEEKTATKESQEDSSTEEKKPDEPKPAEKKAAGTN